MTEVIPKLLDVQLKSIILPQPLAVISLVHSQASSPIVWDEVILCWDCSTGMVHTLMWGRLALLHLWPLSPESRTT